MIHGLYFINTKAFISRQLFKILELITCACATARICVNDDDKRYLSKFCFFWKNSIVVNNVGVDLSRFSCCKFSPEQIAEKRKKYNIDDTTIVFGIVARMVKEKGFLELFSAYRKICGDVKSIILHVGPIDSSRNDQVPESAYADLVSNGKLIMLGLRNDIEEILPMIDVFCLPSHREGFPVSIMEAAAMSIPCITTNIRGCKDAIHQGVTGLLVNPNDIESLASAMKYLANSPGDRKKMGQYALKDAISRFDRNIAVKNTLEVINNEMSRIHYNI